MEKESAQIKLLIGIALILAALVIGYNAFYIPDAVPFAQISTDGSAPVPSESSKAGEEASPVLSINRASAEELDTLPGIGPSLAQAILEYREEHGGFSTLEELMEVPGIGEKIFAELKDQIVLN
ncbi:MAG: ComEA family DNA-binding protein [Hydrogeniiclostridium sp.]